MRGRLLHLMTAAGLVGLAACKETSAPAASLINEATVTSDVAASSGDAMATEVAGMVGNETTAGMSAPPAAFNLFGTSADFTRVRTCYDSTGAVVAACTPLSSVRKIITSATLNATRADTFTVTGGATIAYSGAVHRLATDTLFRNFVSGTETSRTHSGLQNSHDTTSFGRTGVADSVQRSHAETAIDSVRGVTWNLPRFSNPFPVSGYIVRIDSVHATFSNATKSQTRDEVKVVKIQFPPIDAQGNVTLTINGKSCTLNLVTHHTSGC